VKARGGGRHSLKAADTESNLMVESVKRQKYIPACAKLHSMDFVSVSGSQFFS